MVASLGSENPYRGSVKGERGGGAVRCRQRERPIIGISKTPIQSPSQKEKRKKETLTIAKMDPQLIHQTTPREVNTQSQG